MKAKKSKGLLISFEGGEGAGKTVQIKLLADELRRQGQEVVITREPGGTTISEQIRQVVLSPKNVAMAFTTEVLLYQAARAQIYQELILPSLTAGKLVLCDRSRDSSLVYQGVARGFDEKLIEQLNDISTKNTYPDAVILLDLPVKTGLARRNGSKKIDRLDMEKKEFHEKVRKGYLKLAKRRSKNWIVIDGAKSVDQVHRDILSALQKMEIM